MQFRFPFVDDGIRTVLHHGTKRILLRVHIASFRYPITETVFLPVVDTGKATVQRHLQSDSKDNRRENVRREMMDRDAGENEVWVGQNVRPDRFCHRFLRLRRREIDAGTRIGKRNRLV